MGLELSKLAQHWPLTWLYFIYLTQSLLRWGISNLCANISGKKWMNHILVARVYCIYVGWETVIKRVTAWISIELLQLSFNNLLLISELTNCFDTKCAFEVILSSIVVIENSTNLIGMLPGFCKSSRGVGTKHRMFSNIVLMHYRINT